MTARVDKSVQKLEQRLQVLRKTADNRNMPRSVRYNAALEIAAIRKLLKL